MNPTSIQDMRPLLLTLNKSRPLPLTRRISASMIVADKTLKNATGPALMPKFESNVANNPIVPHNDPATSTIK